jgi:DNA ligase 1
VSIPKGFRPLNGELAPDMVDLTYPLAASEKFDGVRCLIFGGVAYSKKLEVIPNKWVQTVLQHLPDGFDGELIVGAQTGNDVFTRSQSGVMAVDGRPDFTYYVFDWYQTYHDGVVPDFSTRIARAHAFKQNEGAALPWLKVVHHQAIRNAAELVAYEDRVVAKGYEGVMVRDPRGTYKFGRSTVKEGILLKIKRFEDHEARIVGKIEEMANTNEQERNEIGFAKRSSKKAGKVGKGTLGALDCALIKTNAGDDRFLDATRFKLGSGISDVLSKQLWEDPDTVGKIVKFKCQGFTPKGKPRFPVYLSLVDERTMSL